MKSILRVRIGMHQAHYAGNLVSGGEILGLFGDAATELSILNDGDEGLLRAYDSVDFLAPVQAGDYIEVRAELIAKGNTSRKVVFEAYKVISSRKKPYASSADALDPPVLVAKASGTIVVPKERQRQPSAK